MLTINKVKIEELTIALKEGDFKVEGKYKLIGKRDAEEFVVTTVAFNGYSTAKHDLKKDTRSLLLEFLDSLAMDIEIDTGVKSAVAELKK